MNPIAREGTPVAMSTSETALAAALRADIDALLIVEQTELPLLPPRFPA